MKNMKDIEIINEDPTKAVIEVEVDDIKFKQEEKKEEPKKEEPKEPKKNLIQQSCLMTWIKKKRIKKKKKKIKQKKQKIQNKMTINIDLSYN